MRNNITLFPYLIKKTAYNGTDFILFANPKFFDDTLIPYSGLYFFIYMFKLLDFVLSLDFTSIGIKPSSL